MTGPFRTVVLAALTAFMVSATATNAAVPKIHCENAQDCPKGDICSIKRGHKDGFCVGARKKKAQLFCESEKDCPQGDICSIRPGHKTGKCVGVKSKAPKPY